MRSYMSSNIPENQKETQELQKTLEDQEYLQMQENLSGEVLHITRFYDIFGKAISISLKKIGDLAVSEKKLQSALSDPKCKALDIDFREVAFDFSGPLAKAIVEGIKHSGIQYVAFSGLEITDTTKLTNFLEFIEQCTLKGIYLDSMDAILKDKDLISQLQKALTKNNVKLMGIYDHNLHEITPEQMKDLGNLVKTVNGENVQFSVISNFTWEEDVEEEFPYLSTHLAQTSDDAFKSFCDDILKIIHKKWSINITDFSMEKIDKLSKTLKNTSSIIFLNLQSTFLAGLNEDYLKAINGLLKNSNIRSLAIDPAVDDAITMEEEFFGSDMSDKMMAEMRTRAIQNIFFIINDSKIRTLNIIWNPDDSNAELMRKQFLEGVKANENILEVRLVSGQDAQLTTDLKPILNKRKQERNKRKQGIASLVTHRFKGQNIPEVFNKIIAFLMDVPPKSFSPPKPSNAKPIILSSSTSASAAPNKGSDRKIEDKEGFEKKVMEKIHNKGIILSSSDEETVHRLLEEYYRLPIRSIAEKRRLWTPQLQGTADQSLRKFDAILMAIREIAAQEMDPHRKLPDKAKPSA